jgi:hypothetical protein
VEISPFYIKNACQVYSGKINYKKAKDVLGEEPIPETILTFRITQCGPQYFKIQF